MLDSDIYMVKFCFVSKRFFSSQFCVSEDLLI